VQLTPTVQATYSNYTQVHQGTRPRYVEYFLEPDPRPDARRPAAV
jgi:NDP-hexose 2,3-dehydratase